MSMSVKHLFAVACLLVSRLPVGEVFADESSKVFRAGAYAIDVTPTKYPVIVNGGFLPRTTDRAYDPLHARCLVLDDGATRLAIVVVDSCMIPRDVCDRAKRLAAKTTGIPTERMLISATHTHSAPSVMMACLGTDADVAYRESLPSRIADGIARAAEKLTPARVGWTVVDDYEHTNCRRWIMRPDRMQNDPFGGRTVRAMMHPGYQNPNFIGPAGPVDPGLSLLSIQTSGGKPMALLANYSMHYFGSPRLSADYYGRFATRIAELIQADSSFVGIMSQGTSGDLHWMDYSRPRTNINIDTYSDEVARIAHKAYQSIEYRGRVSLAMAETKLTLGRRLPDEERLAWAENIIADMQQPGPRTLPEVYAKQAVYLHENPTVELKLQAVRIGELGITAIPNEVYGITGLKLKLQSPLTPTFNMELANGAAGYIPPPEQHALGGYTTWPARTAGLEVEAEPKIVEALLGLLEKVSSKPRREHVDPLGAYPQAVLASKPAAYWRLSESVGTRAHDSSGNELHGIFEPGVALFLPGAASESFSGRKTNNRCAHFAGGRMQAALKDPSGAYSVEMWFWNGLPNDARPVTGYLFSRGVDGRKNAPGDHLGIGGTHEAAGRLIFFDGNGPSGLLVGKTQIAPKTWNHVILTRDGEQVTAYLNGKREPEIAGKAHVAGAEQARHVFIGGRNDNFANFEGKIDEVAFYDRVLSADEVVAHFAAAGLVTAKK